MEKYESFLGGKYWKDEKFREATKQTAKRTETREGKHIPDEPHARIENYLKRFTDIFEREDEKKQTRGIEALKRLLHRKFIVKPEKISDKYTKGILWGNFAEQKGYARGDLCDPDIKEALLDQFRQEIGQDFETYTIPDEERERVKETAVKDQKTRLNSWFDYLTSDEAENYPVAYRYWAFAEMLKLGSYDNNCKLYNKRDTTTVAPFPELDQQVLAMVFDEIQKKQERKPSQIILDDESTQEEFKKRLQSENFGKLYAFIQEHLKTLRLPTERLSITKGKWKVFPKGSDPHLMVKAIESFHTQWCIAAVGTASSYLNNSDLHIYFSQDIEGKKTIPRVCIVRSEESGITEVRGIISDKVSQQHLDDYIVPVVSKRLSSIPGGEKWQSKMDDMKHLARIHIKHCRRETLVNEDLRFLYEIDGPIQSTGYDKDPRITEILSGRDIKDDLSMILNIPQEQISITRDEALSGNIKYHYGNLYIGRVRSQEGLNLPDSISGNLDLISITSAKGLKFPNSIGGNLYLGGIISAEGLNLSGCSIGGYLNLSVTSAEGLNLSGCSIGGGLLFENLSSIEGLDFSNCSISGYINFPSLPSAEKEKLRKKFPCLKDKIE